ncbi:MAG: DUF1987 domain-containing protein [Deltaproteobacteria bacterium]|nr:DUF1987 domain-containing protein [Deltaproteobacteria bacterium]
MDNLNIEATKSTPAVSFDPGCCTLSVKGESYPENAAKFYEPIFHWLRQALEELDPAARLLVELEIIYFNSSSSKALMNLFDTLEEAARIGRSVEVNWRYHRENDSAQECGEEFREDLEALVFNLVEYGD